MTYNTAVARAGRRAAIPKRIAVLRITRTTWRRWACETVCVAAALALTLVASEAFACPTCKEGIAEADPNAQRMAAGYYYSILFMMSMPFVILTTFGSFAYRAVRRAKHEQELADETAS